MVIEAHETVNKSVLLNTPYDELCELLYEKVPASLRSFTHKQLAVFVYSLSERVREIESEWRKRESYSKVRRECSSQLSAIPLLVSMLEDYRYCSLFEDINQDMSCRLAKRQDEGGSVYVICFSDGLTKIGQSTNPNQRIQSIAGSYGHTLLKSWISPRHKDYDATEKLAHRHFRKNRAGGEFFGISFDSAVAWVENHIRKASA